MIISVEPHHQVSIIPPPPPTSSPENPSSSLLLSPFNNESDGSPEPKKQRTGQVSPFQPSADVEITWTSHPQTTEICGNGFPLCPRRFLLRDHCYGSRSVLFYIYSHLLPHLLLLDGEEQLNGTTQEDILLSPSVLSLPEDPKAALSEIGSVSELFLLIVGYLGSMEQNSNPLPSIPASLTNFIPNTRFSIPLIHQDTVELLLQDVRRREVHDMVASQRHVSRLCNAFSMCSFEDVVVLSLPSSMSPFHAISPSPEAPSVSDERDKRGESLSRSLPMSPPSCFRRDQFSWKSKMNYNSPECYRSQTHIGLFPFPLKTEGSLAKQLENLSSSNTSWITDDRTRQFRFVFREFQFSDVVWFPFGTSNTATTTEKEGKKSFAFSMQISLARFSCHRRRPTESSPSPIIEPRGEISQMQSALRDLEIEIAVLDFFITNILQLIGSLDLSAVYFSQQLTPETHHLARFLKQQMDTLQRSLHDSKIKMGELRREKKRFLQKFQPHYDSFPNLLVSSNKQGPVEPEKVIKKETAGIKFSDSVYDLFGILCFDPSIPSPYYAALRLAQVDSSPMQPLWFRFSPFQITPIEDINQFVKELGEMPHLIQSLIYVRSPSLLQ